LKANTVQTSSGLFNVRADRNRLESHAAGFGAKILIALVRVYKIFLSPHFFGSCRFVPSCADYASEALERHGAMRGSWLALKRLTRCHPIGGSGLDPVPLSTRRRSEQ
jgi:putative membrane protein insertion efficiency factor